GLIPLVDHDLRYQATHSGEINVALSEGRLADSDLAGTLGQVVLGEVTLDRDRLTVFDSTGLAVQDLAVAQLLWKRAQAANVGQVISLTE
ncbi:MAG: ornithine cyclodeaminase family protein, partial [Myxococcota bacterium]